MAQSSNLAELIYLGRTMFALLICLLTLSWTTVSLRLWVRLRITKAAGWDDAAIFFSLILFTCYCSVILVLTVGSRRASSATVIRQMRVFIQLGEVFYILTTTFLKISLGLFFLRVLTKAWQRKIFFVILGISGSYGLYYFLESIFHCGNPAKLDQAPLGSRNCASLQLGLYSGYIYGVINILADWTFTLVPIVILIDSKIDRRSKISVGILMSLAAVGSIASVFRLVYLRGLFFQKGFSADTVKATIWATAEPGTGLIAASIAVLRPLYRQLTSNVQSKMHKYGTMRSGSFGASTTEQAKVNNQSALTMRSITTTRATVKNTQHVFSMHAEDVWDPRVSLENVQIGVGRVVRIQSATEDDIRPVPPPKDWPRPQQQR